MKTTNLTLKEAKDSGKPYRHYSNPTQDWINPNKKDHFVTIEHALSSNWEIKVKEVYTRLEVEQAVIRAVGDTEQVFKTAKYVSSDRLDNIVERILKEIDV